MAARRLPKKAAGSWSDLAGLNSIPQPKPV